MADPALSSPNLGQSSFNNTKLFFSRQTSGTKLGHEGFKAPLSSYAGQVVIPVNENTTNLVWKARQAADLPFTRVFKPKNWIVPDGGRALEITAYDKGNLVYNDRVEIKSGVGNGRLTVDNFDTIKYGTNTYTVTNLPIAKALILDPFVPRSTNSAPAGRR